MKKTTFTFSAVVFLIICPIILSAQKDCSGSFTEYFLNSNNIRASFFPRGNKFTSGDSPGLLYPYPSTKKLSTIYASSPWIGGFDDAGNLKLAVETYPVPGNNDYSTGPLTSIGTINDTLCGKFDRAWTVYYEDIRKHIEDYNQNFKIDRPIASIYQWPGRGNKYFKDFYGFELPDDNQGLAPFWDANGDNIYTPEKGDYPAVIMSGYEYNPDQILWMVFNDVDTNYVTGHHPLRFEIQLTAFAFHCQDNEILNNTIFNSYKIIDRAVSVADSVFFGMWTDYDLGCSEDDGIGTDSLRNTEFVYNADDIDGDNGVDCSAGGGDTYASHIPIQSMTYLNYPLHSTISAARTLGSGIEYYRQLNGQWYDGTPMTSEGSGYNPGSGLSPTKFIYNGDPRDTSVWASFDAFPEGTDQKLLSSISLGRMDPGQIREVVTAYMVHYDSGVGHLDQIDLMYRNIDSLFSYINQHNFPCLPFPICADADCVWPGDFNHDGKADQIDLLYWGVMKGATGASRDGQISWREHSANEWFAIVPDGINFKHGDGDGNGIVDVNDVRVNELNLNLTNRFYQDIPKYPPGNDLVISTDEMDLDGRIRGIKVSAGLIIPELHGLSFEIEYDTSIFVPTGIATSRFPSDSITAHFVADEYLFGGPSVMLDYRYAYTALNHANKEVQQGYSFFTTSTGLKLKPGLSTADIPEFTTLRLKNLLALDAEGNDLHLGSEPLIVDKSSSTGISNPTDHEIFIYPNPTHDLLYVDSPIETSGEIINLQGQTIKEVQIKKDSSIDVSGLIPGIYLLRIEGNSHMYKIVIY